MVEPRYSKTQPVPPPMPISAMTARIMSLAETPVLSVPFDADRVSLRRRLQQALRGEHVANLAGSDAES